MKIVITAGGTGGHIFPALSVAMELKKQCEDVSLLWIGTARSREKELSEKHGIPIKILTVQGITRGLRLSNILSVLAFIKAVLHMRTFFKCNRPDAVVAFGGYVCAPVLAAARMNRIPYFLQEQNSVPGLVNRYFAARAKKSFLGFPLTGKWKLKGNTIITGTPVRTITGSFDGYTYPEGFERQKQTVLICGGSQGAASMNNCLIEPVTKMLQKGIQVLWQTGSYSYDKIVEVCKAYPTAFIFESVNDLYPYYAVSKLVICRSGASTLNEIAYFGLPCIMIPLPWSAENHQWMNAAYVQSQGWGLCVAQNDTCSMHVEQALERMLSDTVYYETMCRKALDSSSGNAATIIAREIVKEFR